MHHHLLHDIGIAVLTATALGLLAHWLRQPILLGYLLAGALVGPVGFSLVQEKESIEIISEIGLILLLFIIGLELNVKSLLASGRQLLIGGFGQFPVCALLGVGLFAALGYGLMGSGSDGLYLALLCGLSSTAVVVKLLYDKAELDTLSGRMTLGILVVQDIFAIFILAFQPNFANPSVGPILKALVGTVALLVAGFLVSKFVLRWVFASAAKAPEMVVAVSLGWCAAVAAAAGALGLSKEMGALVAGLSIAAFPYNIHVTAKTLPLRDFFLTLFFMSLGMKITAPTWGMVGPVMLVVGFVTVSRFLSVYPLLALSGAGRRTAFITSLNLAQISEFSMVIASLGLVYGHIAESTVNVTIYAMAITATLSSYGIRYNHQLFGLFEKLLARFGFKAEVGGAAGQGGAAHFGEAASGGHAHAGKPVAVLGFHRAARSLVDLMERETPHLLKQVLVVDFNAETVKELQAKGLAAMFGDIASLDTLEHGHLKEARMILCTIPDMLLKGTDNLTLVKSCRAIAPDALVVATADDDDHDKQLRDVGAGFVLRPYSLLAQRMASLVEAAVTTSASGKRSGLLRALVNESETVRRRKVA